MSVDAQVQRAILRLRMTSPFFAALLLFAAVKPRPGIGTAATDGKDIFYDPAFFERVTIIELQAVLMHEVLHCALRHPGRRGQRDPALWNYAADIVVNGMIAPLGGYELPMGAVRSPEIEHHSAEEVYAILMRQGFVVPANLVMDLLPVAPEGAAAAATLWPHALRSARLIAGRSGQGNLPGGLDREAGVAAGHALDWRTLLWRFLVQTPNDFVGFDRRFIHQGLYLEGLSGESVTIHLAVDTSGSISDAEMDGFLSEVQGILASYPHIRCRLYFADSELHGPFEVLRGVALSKPVGGGGTSFRPFFEAVEAQAQAGDHAVCVYLTDGFGWFPERPPRYPVLWVATPGGLANGGFPFGDVLRMV